MVNLFKSNVESATAHVTYAAITTSLAKHNIPLPNVVGFGNLMMGKIQIYGELSKITRDKMHLTLISLHVCVSEACKVLPKRCEDIARVFWSTNFNNKKNSPKHKEVPQTVPRVSVTLHSEDFAPVKNTMAIVASCRQENSRAVGAWRPSDCFSSTWFIYK